MIRIVLFLISVLVVAWGFAWVADRPGQIAITWMGYRVETSVIVAAFAVAALVLVILAIWSIVPCTTTSLPTYFAASSGLTVGGAGAANRGSAASSSASIVTSRAAF